MTLWQLILVCSLAGEPHADRVEDTLYRVIMASSQGNPLYIHDATTQRDYAPVTRDEAEAIAEELAAAGHHIHVGVSAVPLAVLERERVGTSRGMDACTNIGVASLALEEVFTEINPRGASELNKLHMRLGAYWAPDDPESVAAFSFGARVLQIEPVDVSQQASASRPKPAPRYPKPQNIFFGGGGPKTPGKQPTKWSAPNVVKQDEEEVSP